MEENTEVIEEIEEETDTEKSFGQEIAEAIAVGLVSGAASLAGFYAFGWVLNKVQEIKARKAAKKAALEVVETEEADTTNPEE